MIATKTIVNAKSYLYVVMYDIMPVKCNNKIDLTTLNISLFHVIWLQK